ncbi:MAG: glycosyltransferase family 4 protein [Nisaea sp.]|uniref:glycosyltransferase family 4 protein n=1 Tax=Nisaea sp. TaxID=2024842 RepID=UPI001B02C213|nr:glycosyltransferase family 4 protein [Nisaea sp.]MBO6562292.1 glycosyltransferase family 4 protein [Nisaea sp.]
MSDRKLRILACCHRFDYSGAPLLLFRLLAALADRHEITVLGPKGETVEPGLLKEDIAAGIQIVDTVVTGEFDLLLANTLHGAKSIAQVAGKFPTVFWIHEPKEGPRFIEKGLISTEAFALSDAIIFPTRWQAEELYAPYLKGRTYDIVPYGIEPRSKPRAKPFELPDGATALLQLGWLSPRKGQHLTAAALDYLGDPNIHVFIAGSDAVDPRFADQLKARVSELENIASQVHFLGVLGPDEVDAYLAHVDALVFPTNDDLITVSILEAMARKTPVISSDFGPIPETVIDGETGLLFPVGDVKAFMDCIHRVAGDGALRKRLGDAGHAMFQKKHGFADHVSAMEAVFLRTFCEWKTAPPRN